MRRSAGSAFSSLDENDSGHITRAATVVASITSQRRRLLQIVHLYILKVFSIIILIHFSIFAFHPTYLILALN